MADFSMKFFHEGMPYHIYQEVVAGGLPRDHGYILRVGHGEPKQISKQTARLIWFAYAAGRVSKSEQVKKVLGIEQ